MVTKLEEIAAKARCETKLQFTSLCHNVTRELVWDCLKHIPNRSAPGTDGIDVTQAKETFENWINPMLQVRPTTSATCRSTNELDPNKVHTI